MALTRLAWARYLPLAHLWAEVSMRQGSAYPVLTPGTRGVLGVLERSRKPGRWLPLPSPSTTAEYGFPGANADSVTSEGLTAATYHIKKTLVSSSIEQTFIEHLLSARHCDRCHGKYKE